MKVSELNVMIIARVGKLRLEGQIQPATWFVSKVLLQQSHIHLLPVSVTTVVLHWQRRGAVTELTRSAESKMDASWFFKEEICCHL